MTRSGWIALGLAVTAGALAVARSLPPKEAPVRSAGGTSDAAGWAEFRPSAMPPVRVLLGARPAASLQIEIGGPYLATASGDWRVLAQGSSLAPAEVTATAAGLRIGSRSFASDQVDLRLVQPGALRVAGTRYPGHLRLIRRADGRVAAVNLVGLEEYVLGVLGQVAVEDADRGGDARSPDGDCPDFRVNENGTVPFDARTDSVGTKIRTGPLDEALCAQAIVLRSRTLYEMKTAGPGRDWDLEDDRDGLPYRGLAASDRQPPRAQESRLRKIVGRTRGIALVYQGRLFYACCTAACNGHTLAGRSIFPAAAPPLIGVECQACREADRFSWEKTAAGEQLRSRVAEYCRKTGQSLGPLVRIEASTPPVGRAPEVTLIGTQANCRLSAHLFRTQVAGDDLLPSNTFTVEQRDDSYHFSGRGAGHGAGLCLAGACGLARQGRTCPEILVHYFPGAELIPVW